MKIGILSDIHVDINSLPEDRVTPAICSAIRNNSLDLFITAGDLSSDWQLSLETVERIEKDSGRSCLFVPGNHDLWNEKHPDMTAPEIFDRLAEHPGNLSNGPVRLKTGWSAAGQTCWYDYSFGSGNLFSYDDFEKREHNGRVWQDSIKAVWNRPDSETHEWFLDRLKEDIRKAGDDSLVAVSHMLPIEEFTVPVPDRTWDYFNAFLGSRALGELIADSTNIRYSISGHVHYRREIRKEGCLYICSCLGYSTEWAAGRDPLAEVEKSIRIISI